MSSNYRRSPAYDVDVPPAQNIDAEKSVLAAVLQNNADLTIALEEVKPEDFFHEHLRRVFRAFIALAASSSPFDEVTVCEQLLRGGHVANVPLNVNDISDLRSWGGVDSVRHHARLVHQLALRREFVEAAKELFQESSNGHHAEALERVLRAKEKLDAGDSAKAIVQAHAPIEVKSLTGGAAVDYFAYPVAARGLVTLLDGAAKAAGKTTLLLTSIAALLKGNLFLNRGTKAIRVLYVTEENPMTFVIALDRAGLLEADFHILTRADLCGMAWAEKVRVIEENCVRLKIDWLIVDTFFAVAGLGGELENDAGAVDAAVSPLQSIAGKLNLAVTLTRHTRKSGGEIGESGRGSTALTGAADTILELKRLPGSLYPERRQLEITGRVESGFLEIELRDGLYIVAPQELVQKQKADVEKLDRAISENRSASKNRLHDLTGIGRNLIERIALEAGWSYEPMVGWEKK